jgi:hypothetical protein
LRRAPLTKDDHVKGVPEVITCDNDQEAIRKAEQFVDGHDVEWWDGGRFVSRIEVSAELKLP